MDIGRVVITNKIKVGDLRMGSYKSLGPDGQTLVYQSQWEGVGDDPCNLVKFVF